MVFQRPPFILFLDGRYLSIFCFSNFFIFVDILCFLVHLFHSFLDVIKQKSLLRLKKRFRQKISAFFQKLNLLLRENPILAQSIATNHEFLLLHLQRLLFNGLLYLFQRLFPFDLLRILLYRLLLRLVSLRRDRRLFFNSCVSELFLFLSLLAALQVVIKAIYERLFEET